MKKFLVIVMIMICMMFGGCIECKAYDRELTKEQKEIAEVVYSVCSEHYNKYGVLPSVCLVQCFIESTLGEHCSGNNLCGIASGAESYSSLEECVLRYLEVINNGCYKGAPFEKDKYVQLRKILNGGYCIPEGDYFDNCCWVWKHYDLESYDARMWKERKVERIKRFEKQKKKREREEKLFREKFIKEYKSKKNFLIAGINTEFFRIMEAQFEYERLYGSRVIPQI